MWGRLEQSSKAVKEDELDWFWHRRHKSFFAPMWFLPLNFEWEGLRYFPPLILVKTSPHWGKKAIFVQKITIAPLCSLFWRENYNIWGGFLQFNYFEHKMRFAAVCNSNFTNKIERLSERARKCQVYLLCTLTKSS